MSSAPTATESEPASPRNAATPSRRRWILWAAGVAVTFAVVVAVIGLRGGWDQVEPRGLPEAAPGELVKMKPHAVRVIEWTLSDEIETGSLELSPEADTWLAIHVEATTMVDSATRLQSVTVEPYGVPLVRSWPGEVRLDATGTLDRLQPGLPTDVVLLFAVRSEDVPDELSVQLTSLSYVRSSLSEEMTWLFEEPVARVTVPRNDDFLEALIEAERE